MTSEEILDKAEEIRKQFQTSGQPLTEEESKILAAAYEIRIAEVNAPTYGYGGYSID